MIKTDIHTRNDIETLVNKFYEKVLADEVLSPVFAHVDWPHHFPIMYNFWGTMLLGDKSYEGNPFQKHINLPITPNHFKRWLDYFKITVDENFSGAKAEEAKSRAESIASIFQHKLGLKS